MKFPRLGLINKNQKGFTLIELVVAMLITAIISGGVTTAVFQVIVGSARTNNHMIAVRQVQDAGYWVSHDAQMAQSIRIGDDPATPATEFLTLTWTDWDNKVNQAVYSLENMSGGTLKQLKRSHSLNGTPDATAIVAQFIDPTKTKCELTGGGTFTLPDSNDAFTITGGAGADEGTITVASGSISVTTTPVATYSGTSTGGTWKTPAGSGTVVVRATLASTAGVWTSITASARVVITNDSDKDATITGHVFVFTVTVTVQQQGESRVYEIVPRSG
jgi:prepilin-type N-terminal cleavage/methylation domain-containing protein